MSSSSQNRAVERYRDRLARRGMARFEVQALASDRALLRALARALADDGDEAGQLRQAVRRALGGKGQVSGGILAALRRSPLVDAELDTSRPREEARRLDL